MFFLAFLQIQDPAKKKKDIESNNLVLISMAWSTDVDIDLHVQLPDKRKVWFSSREAPPVHLDVDVVGWRHYEDDFGSELLKDNEEIVSIREIVSGEYLVSAHYFSHHNIPTEVTITIQNVKLGTVVLSETKTVQNPGIETHFCRFTLTRTDTGFKIEDVSTNNPAYFIGR